MDTEKKEFFGGPKLSVLVPVFNEEKTIKEILTKLLKIHIVYEIIVINDGSNDGSEEEVKSINNDKIKLISLKNNCGKTAAISKGLESVSGEIVIIQDADLEYDPDEIAFVIEPIVQGKADVVYGSRFLVKKTSRVLYFYHYIANKIITFLSNLCTNLNMTDIETGYKAFKTPIIKNMELTSRGFGMEVEITALISKLPIRIYEVPISYYGRTYEEGKKIGVKDGFMAIIYILYFNFLSPRRKKRKEYFEYVKTQLGI